MSTLSADEPANFREAMNSPDHDEWRAACRDELDQLREYRVFDLVDLPQGRTPLGNRWVFRVKRDAIGNFLKRKARLVSQGFHRSPE
jgi:hypothetical protein